jgi:hypothetical protein
MSDTETRIKHTPGPWKRTPGRPFDIYQDKGPRQGGRYIGTTRGNSSDLPVSILAEDDANARLMATAPELLEACRAAVNRLIDLGSYGPVEKHLAEVILKAVGE